MQVHTIRETAIDEILNEPVQAVNDQEVEVEIEVQQGAMKEDVLDHEIPLHVVRQEIQTTIEIFVVIIAEVGVEIAAIAVAMVIEVVSEAVHLEPIGRTHQGEETAGVLVEMEVAVAALAAGAETTLGMAAVQTASTEEDGST